MPVNAEMNCDSVVSQSRLRGAHAPPILPALMPEGFGMRLNRYIAATAILPFMLAVTASAEEPLKIGFMTTLSGPAGSVGKHMQDGFNLFLKLHGNKLGGRDVRVITVDDELKPDLAVTKAQALIERDKVDFVTGIIF